MTKQLTKDSLFLSAFLPKNIQLFAQTLIAFKAAELQDIPKTDWIFFGSKNAVRFFFKKQYNLAGKKVACVGEGTFKELVKYHSEINFVGKDVNIEKIGKDFALLVGVGTCLFPISDISRQTIQKYLPPSQVVELIVYHTFPALHSAIPDVDVVVFTSPSNVQNYHNSKGINFPLICVAMGPSTASELRVLGYQNIIQPIITGELGLLDCLSAL